MFVLRVSDDALFVDSTDSIIKKQMMKTTTETEKRRA
jgi:hypothetical protein